MTNRATELKVEAAAVATNLTSLDQGVAVAVLGRSSGWVNVRLQDGQAGWLRAFHIRVTGTVDASGSGGKPFRFPGASRNLQARKATHSMGLRGISTAQLRTASPKPAAWRKLQMFKASVEVAERAALEVGLVGMDRDKPAEPPTAPVKRKTLDDLVQ